MASPLITATRAISDEDGDILSSVDDTATSELSSLDTRSCMASRGSI